MRVALCGVLAVLAIGLALVRAQSEPEMVTSQLTLNAAHGQTAGIYLGEKDKGMFSLSVGEKGFAIQRDNQDVFTISNDGKIDITADILSAKSFAASAMTMNGVPQWTMGALEMFSGVDPSTLGWSTKTTLACQGLTLLVGEKVRRGFTKTYVKLPQHTHVRVTATAHFVDDWQGETAFLKVDNYVVWTQSHDQRVGHGSTDICGNKLYPESRFSEPLEVSIPHTADTVTISFGNTAEDGAELYFGISSLSLSIMNNPTKAQLAAANSNSSENTAAAGDQKPISLSS